MSWDNRTELRADPGIAPGDRGIDYRPRRSIWPAIAVVAAAAAFGGVIWFAYQNGRQATQSGVPPLVKADPSPVKIKPDQPGGQEIPFQDSTVYDKLDRSGQKPVMEKILPPPEAPVTRPQPVTQQPATQPAAAVTDAQPAADAASPTALAPVPGTAIITQPPKPAVAPPVAPSKPVAPPPTSIAALESRALAEMPVKPSGGAYRIQISAVRTPDAVQPEWARLKHRYGDILGGLSVTSSKTSVVGKGDFYRLQAGPLDQAAAKSACDRLRGQGLGCVVVKP